MTTIKTALVEECQSLGVVAVAIMNPAPQDNGVYTAICAGTGQSSSFRGKVLVTDLDGWSFMRLRAFSITGRDVGPTWSHILEVACLCLKDTDHAKAVEEQTHRLSSEEGSVTPTTMAVLALPHSSSAYTSFLLNTRQVLRDDNLPWVDVAQPYQGAHPLLQRFVEYDLVPGKYLKRAIEVMPAFSDNTEILVAGLLLDVQFGENAFLQFLSGEGSDTLA